MYRQMTIETKARLAIDQFKGLIESSVVYKSTRIVPSVWISRAEDPVDVFSDLWSSPIACDRPEHESAVASSARVCDLFDPASFSCVDEPVLVRREPWR